MKGGQLGKFNAISLRKGLRPDTASRHGDDKPSVRLPNAPTTPEKLLRFVGKRLRAKKVWYFEMKQRPFLCPMGQFQRLSRLTSLSEFRNNLLSINRKPSETASIQKSAC